MIRKLITLLAPVAIAGGLVAPTIVFAQKTEPPSQAPRPKA
jgi:hypothetical protein